MVAEVSVGRTQVYGRSVLYVVGTSAALAYVHMDKQKVQMDKSLLVFRT